MILHRSLPHHPFCGNTVRSLRTAMLMVAADLIPCGLLFHSNLHICVKLYSF